MAETTCLLNMRALTGTGGSNPPLSATNPSQFIVEGFLIHLREHTFQIKAIKKAVAPGERGDIDNPQGICSVLYAATSVIRLAVY